MEISTFDAGMATLITGIATAIVHIFITIKAGRSAKNISRENLEQQKKLFERENELDYLNNKLKILEQSLIKINEIPTEKQNDRNYSQAVIQIEMNRIRIVEDIMENCSHYFQDQKKYDEFYSFMSHITEWEEKIRICFDLDLPENDERAIEATLEYNKARSFVPSAVANGKWLVKNSIKQTVVEIDKIIANK
jgi:hypothetical protein